MESLARAVAGGYGCARGFAPQGGTRHAQYAVDAGAGGAGHGRYGWGIHDVGGNGTAHRNGGSRRGRLVLPGRCVDVRDHEPARHLVSGSGVPRGFRRSVDPPLPQKVGRCPVWNLALLCGDGLLSDVLVPGPGTPRTLAGNHLRGGYARLSVSTGAL